MVERVHLLGGHRLVDQPDRISATARAVGHLRHMLPGNESRPRGHQTIRCRKILKYRAFHRNERHAVHDVHAEIRDSLGDLGDVLVVHSRNDDRIDLDRHSVRLHPFDRVELPLEQKLGGRLPAQRHLVVANPRVDLRADFCVDCVQRDCDVADIHRRQFVDVGPDPEAVRGQAEDHLRKPVAGEPQGLHGFLGIRKRIARPGDAHHHDLRTLPDHVGEVVHRLPRGEHRARHARTALVHAVVFPVAEIALDVAARGDRQVDAAEFPVRLFAEARVFRGIECGDGNPRDGFTSRHIRPPSWFVSDP